MKKVAVLFQIARQVEGEFVFINVIKASTNSEKLWLHLRNTQLDSVGKIGDVDCVMEYGVIDNIEVED